MGVTPRTSASQQLFARVSLIPGSELRRPGHLELRGAPVSPGAPPDRCPRRLRERPGGINTVSGGVVLGRPTAGGKGPKFTSAAAAPPTADCDLLVDPRRTAWGGLVGLEGAGRRALPCQASLYYRAGGGGSAFARSPGTASFCRARRSAATSRMEWTSSRGVRSGQPHHLPAKGDINPLRLRQVGYT